MIVGIFFGIEAFTLNTSVFLNIICGTFLVTETFIFGAAIPVYLCFAVLPTMIKARFSSLPHCIYFPHKHPPVVGLLFWSGRQGSNLRFLGPKPSAMPNFATPRYLLTLIYENFFCKFALFAKKESR